MVFSSILFLLYFLPIFLIIYYLVGKKYRNLVILSGSILFYSWGAPKFIFVILGTTLLDFHLVKWMSTVNSNAHRRWLLSLSVAVNIGLLFYFKYSNFFIENVNVFLSSFGFREIIWTKLLLPIGIAFYTFETITYVVDVYRRVHKPLDNFWDYQLYIILFPKLIAGPIVRYHEIADQITDRSHNETAENRLSGFYRFAIGLGKKVIIANHVGQYADTIFAGDYALLDSTTAWAGILSYTFQIYFDFSGYSDMAIGLCLMMGFKLPENFNNPYIASSITDFWRRWHMTLGNWMRNYLYVPLGGNRVESKGRLYLNLWVVFLASGLWHGASWSFVVWGAYHGLFLILERMFLLKVYEKIGRLLSTVITFLVVVTGWVFFRIEDLGNAIIYLKRLFAFSFSNPLYLGAEFYTYFLLGAGFSFFAYGEGGKHLQQVVYYENKSLRNHLTLAGLSMILLTLSVSFITSSGFNPFIYFRF